MLLAVFVVRFHFVGENGRGASILVFMVLMSGTVLDTTSCHSDCDHDDSRVDLRSAKSLYTLQRTQLKFTSS